MRHILVPTDFSVNAANALRYAVQLARACRANLSVMHTSRITDLGPNLPEETFNRYVTDREQIAQTKIREIEQNLASVPDLQYQLFINQGTIVEQITQFAAKYNVDLVVMGTRGASGVLEEWMGGTTSALIEERIVPVLAIPPQAVFSDNVQVGLAFDLQQNQSTALLQPLKALVDALQARVKAFHVEPLKANEADRREVSGNLRQYFSGAELSFYFSAKDNIPEAIEDFVLQEKVSILAMISRKKTFWEQLFRKSITRKMVLHTHIPLLVIPEID
jgi:nucleotide-binding universal stress UspA family protein